MGLTLSRGTLSPVADLLLNFSARQICDVVSGPALTYLLHVQTVFDRHNHLDT